MNDMSVSRQELGELALREPLGPMAGDDDEISLLDLVQVVAENLRLLILGPLLVGLVSLGVGFALPPSYTARTQFLPPQQQQGGAAAMLASLGGLGALAGGAGVKSASDQYIAFLKSEAVQDALVDRFDLMRHFQVEARADARTALAGRVRASAGKDGLVKIEVDGRSPEFAADLANAHIDALRNLLTRLAVTEAQSRRQFFERQLAQSKDALARAEQALRATGVSSATLKASPAAAVSGLAALKAQVTAQEVKLGAMRGYLAETAPDFRQALAELSALRAQLAKLERAEPASAEASGGEYTARFREVKYQETLFELYARQYELARVDEAREGAVIQVVDAAQPPERKSSPKKAQIAVIATLATFFLLLLYVFGRSALAKAAADEEAAAKLASIRASIRKALRP